MIATSDVTTSTTSSNAVRRAVTAAAGVAGRWLASGFDAAGTGAAAAHTLAVAVVTFAVFAAVMAVAAREAVRESFGVLARRPVGAHR